MNPEKSNSTAVIVAGILVLLCCICLLAAGVGGYIFYRYYLSLPSVDLPVLPPRDDSAPTPIPELTRPPVDQISPDTLSTLEQTIVPENNPYALACRLQGKCNIPTTLTPPAAPLQVGAQQKFWVANVDTDENFQVDATLRYITAHSYFWVENGVRYNDGEMKKLMDTFEDKIYPTDREFFGSEWTPGVDGDPHIYIVYTRGTGNSNAGYYSTPDEYNPLIHKYSNGHEMFFFNADNMDLGSEETYGTLAHEFQHMIHWNQDRNETSWVNEGFSMVAEFLNGYPAYFDQYYVYNPDLQLTDWLPDPGSNGPHYGESFLFLTYFLDRFGEDATQALVKDQENSLPSVDDTLTKLNITDPQTGKLITANDVFMDWAAALYLKDGSVGDGRYTYHNYPKAPQTRATETIDTCPQAPLTRTVNQYGIDYIRIACRGDYTLDFTGSTFTTLLPVDPSSGSYDFWSNKGDDSDMTLTREFDFTNVSGPITLSYKTWYDIEEGYDYAYLEVSQDGQNWQILETPSDTDEDPSGNAYGWGYNAKSNGWITEDVSLSAYAGKKIQVRFEYVTDAAVNGEGFLLDDVKVEAAGYSTDFETDDGGWQGEGFVRVQNALPQTFRLTLVIQGPNTTVQVIPLNADQTAQIPLSLKNDESATLVVSGMTRFTRSQASYQIEIK